MGKHTSNEIRQRLVEAVQNQRMTIKQAADLFKIKYSTAHLIYTTWAKEQRFDIKKNKGPTPKYDIRIHEAIVRLFEANPALTLKRCQDHIRQKPTEFHNMVPSIGTINNILAKNNITLKDLRKVPRGRNTPSTIKTRKEYALKWLQMEDTTHFVYLDEFGANLNLRRGKGRSRLGTRAWVEVANSKGHNLSVGAAMDINGPVYHERQFLPYNSDRFISFLKEIVKRLPTVESKETVLVMDNVAFHRCYNTTSWMDANGVKYMFLPPYSPMLNPIEFCFSKVVGYVKAAEANSNCTLFDSIDRGFASITAENATGWFRQSKSYFNKCLTEQRIICENEIDEVAESDLEDEFFDELIPQRE